MLTQGMLLFRSVFFITRGAGFNFLEIIFDRKIRFWCGYFVNQNLVHITRFFVSRVLYSSSYFCVEFPSLYLSNQWPPVDSVWLHAVRSIDVGKSKLL